MSTIRPRDIECDGCGQPPGIGCFTGYPGDRGRKPTGLHLARRADAYWETLRTDARDAPAGTLLADAYDAALKNEYIARGAIAPFIAGVLYADSRTKETA